MSNTKITLRDIFAAAIGFFVFTYSIFLIGKMSAGAHLSNDEILLLTLSILVNALCVFLRK